MDYIGDDETITLVIRRVDSQYEAVLGSYDGALDARKVDRAIGKGMTRLTAVIDLMDQVEE